MAFAPYLLRCQPDLRRTEHRIRQAASARHGVKGALFSERKSLSKNKTFEERIDVARVARAVRPTGVVAEALRG
jgi:hypothetical protein